MYLSNFNCCCFLQAREASELSRTCGGNVKEIAFIKNKEESTNQNNPVDFDSDHSGGTAIKIRTCLAQELDSDSFGAQSSAPRRIRLQMNTLPGSTVNGDVRDVKQSKGDCEVQSAVTEVRIPSIIKLESLTK